MTIELEQQKRKRGRPKAANKRKKHVTILLETDLYTRFLLAMSDSGYDSESGFGRYCIEETLKASNSNVNSSNYDTNTTT